MYDCVNAFTNIYVTTVVTFINCCATDVFAIGDRIRWETEGFESDF